MRAWLRRVPPDLIALLAIAGVMVATHLRAVRFGLPFDEPSSLFHAGHRVAIRGDIPYRDFVWTGGPLPIAVDALAQLALGATYKASLAAAMAITALRVWLVWAIARRLAGVAAASALAAFCAFDPVFATAHHTAGGYISLLVTAAGLGLLCSASASGTRWARGHAGLAGGWLGLTLAVHPLAGLVTCGVSLVAAAILVRRRSWPVATAAALGIGMAIAVAAIAVWLAAVGALGAAVDQLVVAPPALEGRSLMIAGLDAICGGALLSGYHSWWGGLIVYLGLAAAVVGAAIYLLRDEREIAVRTIGVLAIPGAMLYGLARRYLELDFVTDLPRVFLAAVVAVCWWSPERGRRWFGIEPLTAWALGGLALAADAAAELTAIGRGPSDAGALVVGALLIALASPRWTTRARTAACIAVGVAALLACAGRWRDGAHLFHATSEIDGVRTDTVYDSPHRRLRGIKLALWRRDGVSWLAAEVPPRTTCFIYADAPVLYTLLRCTNPTRLDTTRADALTLPEVERALAALRAAPPAVVIVHERDPALPFGPALRMPWPALDGPHAVARMAMYQGVRSLVAGYHRGKSLREVLGRDVAGLAAKQRDAMDALRVYHR